jgi:hypothetical protein
MEIETQPIAALLPYGNNARTHSPEQVKQLADSITHFGWTNPILIDRNNGVIAGHGRLMAAQALGMDEVPCIRLEDMSDEDRRAYVIADNQLALQAGWDEQMLALELSELREVDFDLGLLGFDAEAIEAALNPAEPAGAIEEDEVPEPPVDPVTQPGDVWVLGDHRVMCGDSTKAQDVERLMAGETYHVTVVDPPFEMPNHVWTTWVNDPSIVFGQARHIRQIPEPLWRFERIIAKKYRHRSATVQIDHRHAFVVQVGSIKTLPQTSETFPSIVDQEIDREHDHAKPLSLLVEHLTKWTPEWRNVIDPFSGSGTTLIAAEQLGRRCYGMEISPQYCDVIVKRWQNATGKQATLEATGETFDDRAAAKTT